MHVCTSNLTRHSTVKSLKTVYFTNTRMIEIELEKVELAKITHISIDNGRQTEVVEDFCAVAPDGDGTILSQTFIVKSVDLCYLSAFMVSTNQCNSVRIAYLSIGQPNKLLATKSSK